MNFETEAPTLRVWTLCLAILFLVPSYPYAQTVMVGDIEVDPKAFSPKQDPQTRTAACLACHGKHAGGDMDFGPDVQFGTPALRGMQHDYLKKSLIDYKTRSRPHEEMALIATMLDEQTIDFMARTFAAFPAPPLKSADELAKLADEDPLFRKGQAIAREGRPGTEVPACATCHGDRGEGDADLGPRLAGQNRIYIQQQFAAYAEGIRQSAQAEVMQPVVAGLADDEIEAVAYYYQQLVHVDQP